MAKYVYTAVFTPDETGYYIEFPDIGGCFTQGDSLAEAMDMAQDALALMLYDMEVSGDIIPSATAISDVYTLKGSFTTYISCDTDSYLQSDEEPTHVVAVKA